MADLHAFGLQNNLAVLDVSGHVVGPVGTALIPCRFHNIFDGVLNDHQGAIFYVSGDEVGRDGRKPTANQ